MKVSDEIRAGSEERHVNQIIGTKDWGEKTIEVAYYEIENICSELQLPEEVIQVSKAIYARSLDQKLVEWKTILELSSASVLAACRTQRIAITSNDIIEHSELSKKDLNKSFVELKRYLQLEVGPVDPKDYVERYVEELQRSEQVAIKAEEILEKCMERGTHSGRSPSAYAANAVYCSSLLCNESVSQTDVSNVAGVDVKTIRIQYQEQINLLGEIVDDD